MGTNFLVSTPDGCAVAACTIPLVSKVPAVFLGSLLQRRIAATASASTTATMTPGESDQDGSPP
jgi:hypothetical protein